MVPAEAMLRGLWNARTNGDALAHGDASSPTLVTLGRLRLRDAGQWWRRLFGLSSLEEAEKVLEEAGVFYSPRSSRRRFLRDNAMRDVVDGLSTDQRLRRLRNDAGGGDDRVPPTLAEGFVLLGDVVACKTSDCLDLSLMALLAPVHGNSAKNLEETLGRAVPSLALYAHDETLEEEWLWWKSLLCSFYAFCIRRNDDDEERRSGGGGGGGGEGIETSFSSSATETTLSRQSFQVQAMLRRAKVKAREAQDRRRHRRRQPKGEGGGRENGAWVMRKTKGGDGGWLGESFRGRYRLNNTACWSKKKKKKKEEGDGRWRRCNLQTFAAERIRGEAGRLHRLTVCGSPSLVLGPDDLGGVLVATDLYERLDATPLPLCETTPEKEEEEQKQRQRPPVADDAEDERCKASFVHATTDIPFNAVSGCPCMTKALMCF